MADEVAKITAADWPTREIRTIRNWHEWLTFWQRAQTIQEMLGLLHVGMETRIESVSWDEPKYDDIDRYQFYLTLADGGTGHFPYQLPESAQKGFDYGFDTIGRRVRVSGADLRKIVARKAFEGLASSLFKLELKDNDDDFSYQWQKEVCSERLFPTIKHFFRLGTSGYWRDVRVLNLYMLHERSHDQQARKFLLNLCEFIWGWEEKARGFWSNSQEETEHLLSIMRERMNAAKPWATQLLFCLGDVSLLRRNMLTLDPACISAITEMALVSELSQHRHPVIETRQVKTVDEACYVGSGAGLFLKELELKRVEHARLSQIEEAEKKLRDAQREISRLSSAKKK